MTETVGQRRDEGVLDESEVLTGFHKILQEVQWLWS